MTLKSKLKANFAISLFILCHIVNFISVAVKTLELRRGGGTMCPQTLAGTKRPIPGRFQESQNAHIVQWISGGRDLIMLMLILCFLASKSVKVFFIVQLG